MPKKMSKGLYIAGLLGGGFLSGTLLVVAFVLLMIAASEHTDSPPLAAFGLMAGALVPFIFSYAVLGMFVYRMWAAIQDGQARTTPGQAAGFILIPLFNFYWAFQAFHGFAQDYNKYIARRQLNVPRLDEQLFLWYPIAILCGIIPWVGILASLVSTVLLVMIIVKTCEAVNALPLQSSMAASTAG
jgi:hypothetical protein